MYFSFVPIIFAASMLNRLKELLIISVADNWPSSQSSSHFNKFEIFNGSQNWFPAVVCFNWFLIVHPFLFLIFTNHAPLQVRPDTFLINLQVNFNYVCGHTRREREKNQQTTNTIFILCFPTFNSGKISNIQFLIM